ncbi:MAG: acyl-CoA carboxylase subunit epsilon [Actinomycetota bacterium]|nr:acyl-CoA carboxylase subunit epsilon [Actinomycetota bacterium]MDQ2957456.1 acyl-CoA carboxylase subunit epsilon [Actinomycetota bacterium]
MTEPEVPVLQIVSGNPDAQELAAVTALLTALATSSGGSGGPAGQPGGWSDLSLRLRRSVPPGPGAWRNSTWY